MKTTTKIIIGLITVSYLLPFIGFEIERTTEKVFLDTSVRASFKAKEAKAIASYAIYIDQLNTDQYRVMLIPDDKLGGIVVDYPAELVEVSLSKGVLQINKTKKTRMKRIPQKTFRQMSPSISKHRQKPSKHY